MVKIKFYLTTQEITREQTAALKNIYTHSVHSITPLEGSSAELILLKFKLLNEEALNSVKTAQVRSSNEYFEAKKEAIHLNKVKNDGFIICEYCKCICTEDRGSLLRYTVDHVVPLSEGGDATSQSNLKIACRFCNRLKGSMTEAVFLKIVRSGKKDILFKEFENFLLKNSLLPTNEILAEFINKNKYKLGSKK